VIAIPNRHLTYNLVVARSRRSTNQMRNAGHHFANAELAHCPLHPNNRRATVATQTLLGQCPCHDKTVDQNSFFQGAQSDMIRRGTRWVDGSPTPLRLIEGGVEAGIKPARTSRLHRNVERERHRFVPAKSLDLGLSLCATNCVDDLPDRIGNDLRLLQMNVVATVGVGDVPGVREELGETVLGHDLRRPE
jgi:hypothetical protein